jgi:hypothetical protein
LTSNGKKPSGQNFSFIIFGTLASPVITQMQITKAMPIKKPAIRFDVSQAFVLVRAMLDK